MFGKTRSYIAVFVCITVIVGTTISCAWKKHTSNATIVWELNDPQQVAGHSTVVLGNPLLQVDPQDTSICFNGINDGIVLPVIPIQSWKVFTIEVLFKPDADGPVAPRFIHFEDVEGNRGTFEIRLKPNGQWYLDAFLKNGKANKGLALIDSTQLHAAGKWYWAAMAYDGKKLYSYVNGQPQLNDAFDFPAMQQGQLSMGVRLNKVSWFKGCISQVRFHPVVLNAADLQR